MGAAAAFGFCALLAAGLRWWPLWLGAGLVGGDIYTYFLPLKFWYAQRLQVGELALWNPLIGNGAPVLAESQTGVFYPFNLLLYRCLPVQVAFNAALLIHYVLAFVFVCLYLRRLGIGVAGSIFGSVVFVYGWFPARSCLEWAIVTGAWTPAVMCGVEGVLTGGRGRWRWSCLAALGLAMQLLAGHFHVAFITLFGAALYAPMRCWWLRMPLREGVRHCGRLAACCLLSGAMAAVQLWPTWELKARSQRAAGRAGHDPNYGRIPAWYLAQAIAPWLFYPEYRSGGSLEARLAAANTNRVEAHLYFGILPLLLAAAGFMAGRRRPDAGPLSRGDKGRPGRCRPDTSALLPWLIVGLSALVMATGCWTERFGWLPGPGYFTGPGRYGLLAQLAVSVAAACGLDAVLCRVPGRASQAALAGVVVAATWADLSWATERVSYAQAVWPPPISLRDRSPLAARLKLTDRVLSRNQNAMTLLGTAMLPVYLGIGPAQYFEGPAALPGSLRWDGPMSPAVADWLRQAGVTHVLAFEPHPDWPLELVWRGVDPMLHYMLGRSPQQPLWLYRLSGSLGRAYAVAAGSSAKSAGGRVIDGAVRSIQLAANEVVIRVQLPVSAIVVLTDLAYPGWRVEVDGQARPGRLWRGTYRAVAVRPGSHTVRWYYRPASALRGGAISLLGWLSWVAVLAVPWCRRRKDA